MRRWRRNPPPLHNNRTPKIYYATQVGTEPPTIVLFCNDPQALGPTYRRYLLGVLRDRLPFSEVPIKLYLRKREDALDGGSQPAKTPAGHDEKLEEADEDEE